MYSLQFLPLKDDYLTLKTRVNTICSPVDWVWIIMPHVKTQPTHALVPWFLWSHCHLNLCSTQSCTSSQVATHHWRPFLKIREPTRNQGPRATHFLCKFKWREYYINSSILNNNNNNHTASCGALYELWIFHETLALHKPINMKCTCFRCTAIPSLGKSPANQMWNPTPESSIPTCEQSNIIEHVKTSKQVLHGWNSKNRGTPKWIIYNGNPY